MFPKRLRSLAQKNEGEDIIFQCFFKFFLKKLTPKKFAVHIFIPDNFYKNYNILKVKKYFLIL